MGTRVCCICSMNLATISCCALPRTPDPRLIGKIGVRVGEGITGWVAREAEPVAIARHAQAKDGRFKVFNSLPEDKYEAFYRFPSLPRLTVHLSNQRSASKSTPAQRP